MVNSKLALIEFIINKKTMQSKRRKEEENVLCSLSSLTNFCLKECVKPGLGHLLPQVDPCFTTCCRNVIEMRFHTRDKWMEDYS